MAVGEKVLQPGVLALGVQKMFQLIMASWEGEEKVSQQGAWALGVRLMLQLKVVSWVEGVTALRREVSSLGGQQGQDKVKG